MVTKSRGFFEPVTVTSMRAPAFAVAGPFTVESLSPHRALGVDEND